MKELTRSVLSFVSGRRSSDSPAKVALQEHNLYQHQQASNEPVEEQPPLDLFERVYELRQRLTDRLNELNRHAGFGQEGVRVYQSTNEELEHCEYMAQRITELENDQIQESRANIERRLNNVAHTSGFVELATNSRTKDLNK